VPEFPELAALRKMGSDDSILHLNSDQLLVLKSGDEEHKLLFPPQRAGRQTGRSRAPEPGGTPDLERVVSHCQQQLTEAALVLLAELQSRLASSKLLEAFIVLSPEYWWQPGVPTTADFKAKLATLVEAYGRAAEILQPGMDQATVMQPLIDKAELEVQSGFFYEQARSVAVQLNLKLKQEAADRQRKQQPPGTAPQVTVDNYHDWEVSSTQSDDEEPLLPVSYFTTDGDMRPPLSRFWAAMCSTSSMAGRMSQFATLARILITIVPGSVEEERLFSAMNFLKHRLRSRLTTGLVPAMRVFTDRRYTLAEFPVEAVTEMWLNGMGKRRRMV
jgi:hypothetical protein